MDSGSPDFTQLWERHIAVARKEFASTTREDDTTLGVGHAWDEKMDSVVDALELALQSPPSHSHPPSSPEPLWSVLDEYSESATAPPSPHGSVFSSTTTPIKTLPTPIITITEHSPTQAETDGFAPDTPMVEIGGRYSKGKELASYYLDRSRQRRVRDASPNKSNRAAVTPKPSLTLGPKEVLYRNYASRYIPEQTTEPETPVTSFRDVLRVQNPPPIEVHVLTLTWAKHDRRGEDGQLLSPGLDIETDSVRSCFKRRGYRVQCRLIPEDYPTSAVETIMDKFLAKSVEGNLCVVYYKGEGCVEEGAEGRMVFSSGFGGSSFYWEDVRDPIMQAPGDLLMIMDCSAAPGVENPEIKMEAGFVPSPSTKQLLGSCASYGMGIMGGDNFVTKALCRALDGAEEGRRGGQEGGKGMEEEGRGMASVQSLCSEMKESLRRERMDPGTVFVKQLGGGQLMDIWLPTF